jgi:hypothetical protein
LQGSDTFLVVKHKSLSNVKTFHKYKTGPARVDLARFR